MTAARRRSGGAGRREEKGKRDRSVNLEVDTRWELVENATLSRLEGTGGERHYAVKVLRRPGHESPTQEFLKDLCSDKNEFEGLLAKVRGLLRSPRRDHGRFCRPGRGTGKGAFEFKAKGKEFRLFFFYGEDYGLGLRWS